MRIVLVHSFYASDTPSGENDVVLAQANLLSRHGHEVLVVSKSTDEMKRRLGYAVVAGIRVATGAGSNPNADIEAFGPDVVHVHNLFPNFGTRWLKHTKFPIVASMHNYRQVCANGLLYRNGEPCFKCVQSTWPAIRHSCYRDSRLSTVPLALALRGGADTSPLLTAAQIVCVPSERAFDNFLKFGVPAEKLRLVPYSIPNERGLEDPNNSYRHWLFAGRVSVEKGLRELLAVWPRGERLDIAGAGPDAETLAATRAPNVRFLGHVAQKSLSRSLPNYEGLVLPGRSPEGIPSIALHALAAGVPVVARPGNGAADLIEAAKVGAIYPEDTTRHLVEALSRVRDGGLALRKLARQVFESQFTEGIWLQNMENIYQKVASHS